jgi:hypothetical protein
MDQAPGWMKDGANIPLANCGANPFTSVSLNCSGWPESRQTPTSGRDGGANAAPRRRSSALSVTRRG